MFWSDTAKKELIPRDIQNVNSVTIITDKMYVLQYSSSCVYEQQIIDSFFTPPCPKRDQL